MAELIKMPKLGFNMSKGKLIKWYKKEGEKIEKGEPFFEITTDKTSIDVEATLGGVVRKIMAEEGEEFDVFTPIAVIGDKDEDISNLLDDLDFEIEAELEEVKLPEKEREDIVIEQKKLTPRAKEYINRNELDITDWDIVGTGYEGGITEKNIIKYLKENSKKVSPVAKNIANIESIDIKNINGTGARGKVIKADVVNYANKINFFKNSDLEISTDGKEIIERVPYSGVRKIIGEKLAESKFTSPHLYFKMSVDMKNLIEFRKQINNAQEHKTSVTDYFTLAVSKALQKYPDMNSALIGDEIIKYKSVNIGIAVAADSGLIVPVVKDTEIKSLVQISKDTKNLVSKARDGKLVPEDYTGGTFTISNLGMFGIEEFTAIINPPEVGILSVSASIDKPVVINDNGEKLIEIRPISKIDLSVDHRIIDGLLAAQFVGEIKRQLENPLGLLL